MAEELLRAADQYMLEGLKRLCEDTLQKTLSVDTLQLAYELSENFNAAQLGRHCVMFALEAYSELSQVRSSLVSILPGTLCLLESLKVAPASEA